MKKIFMSMIFGLISVTTIISVTGCSNNTKTITQENGNIINTEFSMSDMKTISGNNFDIENDMRIVVQPEMGMGVQFTDTIHQLLESGKMGGYIITPYSLGVSYFVNETNTLDIMGLWRYEQDIEGMEESFEMWKGIYTDVEELAKVDNNTYYFGYNKSLDLQQADDTQKEEINSVISQIDEVKNNICIFKPSVENEEQQTDALKSFETTTINGETVTQDIFSNYDITMVNIWATWCGPCLTELPKLAELHKELPENSNMITICTDAVGNEDVVKDILNKSNAEFMTLIPSEQLEQEFLYNITSIPYTIFVNSKGEIVGNPQIGVPSKGESIKDAYKQIINERIEMVKGGQQ